MKNLILFAQLLFIIGCGVSSPDHTYGNSKTSEVNEDSNSNELQISRYYYTKHFENMVTKSLAQGFSLYDQYGNEDSYLIIKAAYTLAINGDTLVEAKMFEFLDRLANSEREYKVDESIDGLIDFYVGLDAKKLFLIGMVFLDPNHLYIDSNPNSDTGNNDFTSMVFIKLLKLMTKEDREYYNNKFWSLYSKAIEKNVQNVALNVWNDFYPYLKEELTLGNIQFVKN